MDGKGQSERIKIYVVVALSIVAAVLAYFRFFAQPRPPAPTPEADPAEALYTIPDLSNGLKNYPSLGADGPRRYKPPSRDIFAPVEAAAPPESANPPGKHREPEHPRLSSIMESMGRRRAIIDGKLVSEGERVGAYTVSSIGQRQVTLTSPGAQLTLTMGE